jgi:hypothetical protein
MEPDLTAGDQEAADMAQFLGFSSFGAKDRPQKKRKYNAQADAVVGGQPSSRAKAANFNSSTGANSTPLGAPPEPAPSANADEIDLDGEEEDGGETAPAASGLSSETVRGISDGLPVRPAGGLPPHHAGIPERLAQGHYGGGAEHHGHRHNHQSQRPQGSRETPWYEGYYDSLSNTNPWQKLEHSLGLQSKGTWVSYSSHNEQQPIQT